MPDAGTQTPAPSNEPTERLSDNAMTTLADTLERLGIDETEASTAV